MALNFIPIQCQKVKTKSTYKRLGQILRSQKFSKGGVSDNKERNKNTVLYVQLAESAL